jgi:hypothetical protein
MTVEYGNSELTQAQRALMEHRRRGLVCTRSTYYRETALPVVLAGLAAYAAYLGAESPFLLLIALGFTGITTALIYRWRSYDRWLHSTYFPPHLDRKQKLITLEIADDGLHEQHGDIVSFAPWHAVTGTAIQEDLLIIKLSNGHEAVLPRQSSGLPDLNLDEIRNEIDRRRMPNERSA